MKATLEQPLGAIGLDLPKSFDRQTLEHTMHDDRTGHVADHFLAHQTRLTLLVIILWTLVQVITFFRNLFIYNLLSEPIHYPSQLIKRAIPWITGLVFIYLINYSSRHLLKIGVRLYQLPIIHFGIALVISCFMYVSCYYAVVAMGVTGFEQAGLVNYFVVEIDRLFLIYLLVSLLTTAHHYFAEVRAKDRAIHDLELAYRQSKIVALNNEVNPHMIFNTLNNIHTLLDEDPEGAKKMIVDFSTLVRNNLKNKRSIFTTLAHERRFLEDYLSLQNNGAASRYQIAYEIEPGLDDAVVPKMVLQPLVENAIKHSHVQDRPLVIKLQAYQEQDHLFLAIENQITKQKSRFGKTHGMGIGTENIQRRLNVLYGEDFRFQAGQQGQIFSCLIMIPLDRATTT